MLVERLSQLSGVSQGRLMAIAASASRRYRTYQVPKKTGGFRTIDHPGKQLKSLQRWVSKVVFSLFPIHPAATAYTRGSNIRKNAERHKETNFTNRYDFEDFFPSFGRNQIISYLSLMNSQQGIGLSEVDINFIADIVCKDGHLTIGAPSSPIITNCMMFAFDVEMSNFCIQHSLIYTRYADDLFVSSVEPNNLDGLDRIIGGIIIRINHLNLKIKGQKTALLSRRYARKLAGITITSDRRISIGRTRKREIKSLVHKWIIGDISPEKYSYLRGLIAFAIDAEPTFQRSLSRKYGEIQIQRLLHDRDPSTPGNEG